MEAQKRTGETVEDLWLLLTRVAASVDKIKAKLGIEDVESDAGNSSSAGDTQHSDEEEDDCQVT